MCWRSISPVPKVGTSEATTVLDDSVHAGIRKAKLDLAVVRSTVPAVGAAMFTANRWYRPQIDRWLRGAEGEREGRHEHEGKCLRR